MGGARGWVVTGVVLFGWSPALRVRDFLARAVQARARVFAGEGFDGAADQVLGGWRGDGRSVEPL